MTKNIINFLKKETVLSISWLFAILSTFFVKPSTKYLSYIDFRTLGILWSLMIIMAGFRHCGIFDIFCKKILKITKSIWQLATVLIFICFFSSMFITNDVALITFVPFAIFILTKCKRQDLLIPVIVLQTIAANLGSMITPIGNPQNLYLYTLSNMKIKNFIFTMLPYSAITFILLVISIYFLPQKNETVKILLSYNEKSQNNIFIQNVKILTIGYTILFFLSLFVVARLFTYLILVVLVFLFTLLCEKQILLKADYILLFTFIGFFIFTGNLANISSIHFILTSIVSGKEILVAILASQIISNVPAAFLLSPFTQNIKHLIIGVNLGGLGSLIASMASLISYTFVVKHYPKLKYKYLIFFTFANIIYLIILLIISILFKI